VKKARVLAIQDFQVVLCNFKWCTLEIHVPRGDWQDEPEVNVNHVA
jgi:hypothetical protein